MGLTYQAIKAQEAAQNRTAIPKRHEATEPTFDSDLIDALTSTEGLQR
jgi:hypothetical protein